MRKTVKIISLLFILIFLASNILAVKIAAAAITKPSIPEFSLKLVAYPYDVAPTTTIDPFNGKEITTSYGYHEENRSIEITIKNLLFTSVLDDSGNYTSLYYDVMFKGHFDNIDAEWRSVVRDYNASASEYTVVTVSLNQLGSIPVDSQIDFKVRALIGYEVRKAYDSILPESMKYYHEFIGQAGDWSNTQTIAVDEAAPTPMVTPTQPATIPTPTATALPTENPISPVQPDTQTGFLASLNWRDIVIVVLAALLVCVVLVVALSRRKR